MGVKYHHSFYVWQAYGFSSDALRCGCYAAPSGSPPLVISVQFYTGKRSPYPYSTRWLDDFDDPTLAGTLYSSAFPLVDVTVITDDDIAVWLPWPYCRNIFISATSLNWLMTIAQQLEQKGIEKDIQPGSQEGRSWLGISIACRSLPDHEHSTRASTILSSTLTRWAVFILFAFFYSPPCFRLDKKLQ